MAVPPHQAPSARHPGALYLKWIADRYSWYQIPPYKTWGYLLNNEKAIATGYPMCAAARCCLCSASCLFVHTARCLFVHSSSTLFVFGTLHVYAQQRNHPHRFYTDRFGETVAASDSDDEYNDYNRSFHVGCLCKPHNHLCTIVNAQNRALEGPERARNEAALLHMAAHFDHRQLWEFLQVTLGVEVCCQSSCNVHHVASDCHSRACCERVCRSCPPPVSWCMQRTAWHRMQTRHWPRCLRGFAAGAACMAAESTVGCLLVAI